MITYQRQSLDASYEERYLNRRSAGSDTYAQQAKAADFTDREIELYMLSYPQNPSPSLRALYAAIRRQMIADGCP